MLSLFSKDLSILIFNLKGVHFTAFSVSVLQYILHRNLESYLLSYGGIPILKLINIYDTSDSHTVY